MDINIRLYIIINFVVNQSLFVENYPLQQRYKWSLSTGYPLYPHVHKWESVDKLLRVYITSDKDENYAPDMCISLSTGRIEWNKGFF